VHGGVCASGEVVDAQMRLSDLGQIADAFWTQVPQRFPDVSIDQRIAMPNHAHAIILIHDPRMDRRGGVLPPSEHEDRGPTATKEKRPTLGQTVAYYKYQTTAQINDQRGYNPARFWQRGFHDHGLRNRRALQAIRKYIVDNPRNWELDRDDPDNVSGGHR
jgi:REP element-mobilizing transposase RayT